MDKQRDRKQEIRDELKEISPFLYKMKEKDSPFKVPDHYFNNFSNQVLEQLKQETAESPQKKDIWNLNFIVQAFQDQLALLFQSRLVIGLASVVILAVAAWILYPSGPDQTAVDNLSFASLSVEEIQNYIDDNLETFDEETFKELAHENSNISLLPAEVVGAEEIDQYLDQMIEEMDAEDLEELF